MRADAEHRVFQSVQFVAGTVEGTQAGPPGVDKCLIDVE